MQVNDALAARAGNNVLLIAYLGEPLSGGSTEAHQVWVVAVTHAVPAMLMPSGA
jgi:hypothetical protein